MVDLLHFLNPVLVIQSDNINMEETEDAIMEAREV
jgi:hypothetical protein